MTVTLESTTKIVNLNGVPARVWEGKTDTGIPVHAFITRIAVHQNENEAQFKKELEECKAPLPEINAYPLSLIL